MTVKHCAAANSQIPSPGHPLLFPMQRVMGEGRGEGEEVIVTVFTNRSTKAGRLCNQGQPNGRDILPPMPWEDIKAATDEDLKAIWAYLRSIPPVKNQVPFPVPPTPQK